MPEEKDPNKLPDGPRFPFGSRQFKITAWATLIILGALTVFNYFMANRANSYIDFSEFKKRIADGVITRVELDSNVYYGVSAASRRTDAFGRVIQEAQVYRTVALYDPDFIRLLDEKGVAYAAISREGDAILSFLITWVFPFLLLFLIWRVLSKRMASMGSGMLAMGQNKAVVVAEGDVKTRFKDVAGADEAKEELVEVVDFLKNPRKYTEIGGRIPKGVLLVGPPGTGKTLLARAVAGEAKVPFFRMSGAEFVEMFVGVGASRVRDLFQKARGKAPCIVFIDELDAIGKSRINTLSGNDEREQTLNQLLVEMDGFDATSGLIILAATNRPDVLDPALLRPGRFDRQVLVDRPDLAGREAILEIHAKAVKLGPDVDLKAIARATPGFVGADLANVINESALLAVRAGRKLVSQADLMEAIEKAVAGLQKKSRIINPEERKVVAVHETGHALMAGLTVGADPVQKISIVPRGFGALGYTIQMPTEDRYLMTLDELHAKMEVLLGGRAAEEIVFGRISTGAANDLTKATDIARSMIVDYGMSEKFKNVALTERGKSMLGGPSVDPFLRREYSESTQSYVDEEIARIIAERYEVAKGKLQENRALLDKVSNLLLEKETIDEGEFKAILEGV